MPTQSNGNWEVVAWAAMLGKGESAHQGFTFQEGYWQPLRRLQRRLKRCPLELETLFKVVQPTRWLYPTQVFAIARHACEESQLAIAAIGLCPQPAALHFEAAQVGGAALGLHAVVIALGIAAGKQGCTAGTKCQAVAEGRAVCNGGFAQQQCSEGKKAT
nr:hypothetical protein [Pseudomonas sp. BIGb0427]